jgi:hypothetical protein
VREGQVGGPDWTLTDVALEVGREGRTRSIPLDQITEADWHGDDFCLWVAGSDAPAARFAATAENTHLLGALLARFVDRRASDQEDAEGLGRRLAEFKNLNLPVSVLVLLVTGGAYAAAVYPLALAVPWKIAGALIPMLVTAGLCEVIPGGVDRLRHHSRGIVLVRGRREFSLPFDELRSFSVRWVDHHQNGFYMQTTAKFTFYSDGRGDRPNPLQFVVSCKRHRAEHAQAQGLQEQAAATVALRWRTQLADTGSVLWTRGVTIRPDGLEIQPRPGDAPVRVPFSVECRSSDGRMTFLARELGRPFSVSTDSENFFAGLKLLEYLVTTENADRSASDLATSDPRNGATATSSVQ